MSFINELNVSYLLMYLPIVWTGAHTQCQLGLIQMIPVLIGPCVVVSGDGLASVITTQQ